MSLGIIAPIISEVIGLGSELIEDKDKKNEFADKAAERAYKLAETLIKQQTTPWVDATVKLSYAARDCLIPLFRPVFGVTFTLLGAYLAVKHPNIHEMITGTLVASGPAWGVSRHIHKKNEVKQKYEDPFEEDD